MNGLFQLHVDIFINYIERNMNAVGSKHPRDNLNEMYLWHLRLSHIREDRINRMKKIRQVVCWLSSHIRSMSYAFKKKWSSFSLLDMKKRPQRYLLWYILIFAAHLMCRPEEIFSTLFFIDDFSRYRYMYFMHHKSETFDKFKEFRHEVEKHTEMHLKALRSDQRGE